MVSAGVIVVAAGVIGLGTGSALAIGPTLFAPSGVTTEQGINAVPMPAPTYETNSNGLTYGSAADSDKPENEPDLIRVLATNGKEGYVKKTELEDADGTTAARSFKSPEDAVAWQYSEGLKDRTVAVYASDGETVIGEFLVVGAETQQKSLSSTDLPLD